VLYNQALTTFAGAIYFPTGTVPNIVDGAKAPISAGSGAGTAYYCLDTTGCFHFGTGGVYQLWQKDIAGLAYPFFVGFYDLPQSKNQLRILDSTW
jgi:hypothetical protein